MQRGKEIVLNYKVKLIAKIVRSAHICFSDNLIFSLSSLLARQLIFICFMFTEMSPDSLNLLMILCSVNDGMRKIIQNLSMKFIFTSVLHTDYMPTQGNLEQTSPGR